MDPSPLLIEFVKGWEGLSLSPYADTAGRMTIGYGHCLSQGERCTSLTQPAAEQLLGLDLSRIGSEIVSLITVAYTQQQYDALLDFAFNLGAGSLAGSTLLKLLNADEPDAAAEQFLAWDHVRDPISGMLVPNEGLEKRRTAEKAIFSDGDYSGRP